MTEPRIRTIPRSKDIQVIRWLEQRQRGVTITEIRKAEGMKNDGYIAQATKLVRDADVAESGEPAEVVLSAYQWRKKTGGRA